MWSLVIPILAVLSVAQVVLIFWPKLWLEIRNSGVRWNHYFTFVIGPAALAFLLTATLIYNVDEWKPWMVLLAWFVISTWIVEVVLAFRGIRGVQRSLGSKSQS